MVQLLRDNVQDFIGAARPSIADPLPKKISLETLRTFESVLAAMFAMHMTALVYQLGAHKILLWVKNGAMDGIQKTCKILKTERKY